MEGEEARAVGCWVSGTCDKEGRGGDRGELDPCGDSPLRVRIEQRVIRGQRLCEAAAARKYVRVIRAIVLQRRSGLS